MARSTPPGPRSTVGAVKAPLVLLYHAVAPLNGGDLRQRTLFVQPDTFAAQMEYLARKGYRSLTLAEYAAALEGRIPSQRRFLLTFDDAYTRVDEFVSPVLSRLRYSAVMFAPSAHLGGRNIWDSAHPALSRLEIMTGKQLEALESGPWEVASHGGRHLDLRTLPSAARRRELRAARDSLSALLGHEVWALAYPYGYQDAGVRADAEHAGFRLAFKATVRGPLEPLRVPRRPIKSWDGPALFRLRTAATATLLFQLEDAARVPLRLGRVARKRAQAAFVTKRPR